jgi:glycosyltransferase involved in cell wall biosynthesis
MSSQPGAVTVGIPTFNRSAYVVRAIESVLAQTYADVRVVVSDNASTDDTPSRVAAIRDPRLSYVRQETNLGMTGNFNACLSMASGEFFLLLSDDDFLDPAAIESLIRPFREGVPGASPADIGNVWCPVRIVDSAARPKWTTAAGPPVERGIDLVVGLFKGSRGPRLCSMLVRTADMRKFGGYAVEHGPICDVGNWSRVAASSRFAVCIQQPLSNYTVHQNSITSEPQGELWQRSGERVCADVIALLESRGLHDEAKVVRRAGRDNVTNLLVTVMMQQIGCPGWKRYWVREVVRAPQFFFTATVFRRLLFDGWKLVRQGLP